MKTRSQEDRPVLLLVDPGPATKEYAIRQLLALPSEIYFAIGERSRWITALASVDHIIETDPSNVMRLVNDVVAFQHLAGVTFNGAGTFEEISLCQTLNVAEALNLPHQPFASLWKSSRAKVTMRQELARGGLASPRFEVVRGTAQLLEAARRFPPPCVIKPTFGEGGLGVVLVPTLEHLHCIVPRLALASAPGYPEFPPMAERPYLIEEYCGGPLVSIDGYVQNGRCSIVGATETEIEAGEAPLLVANYIPPRLPPETIAACQRLAELAVKQLSFDDCGFHCECRCTSDGPRVIEIAARMPGGKIPEGYDLAYGISFPRLMHDLFLGRTVELQRRRARHVAQRGVFPRQSGIVLGIDEPFSANKPSWLAQFDVVSPVGSRIGEPSDSPVPLYYFAVTGNSREEVAEREESVLAGARWKIEARPNGE